MTLSEYVDTLKEKKICVIGYGVSNEPLTDLLLKSGCDVTVADRRTLEQLGEKGEALLQAGAKLALGKEYLDHLDFNVIFRSPSLLPFEEHLLKAKENGALITSEMEAFFELCPCKIFAVTGSDGKSTTTTIIATLLKEAGFTVHLGGNLGHPLLCDLPQIKADDVAVVELSSFQLHSMHQRPDVAVITNISPNHLDKHKDYEDYITAKKSVFLSQTEEDTLVLNMDDDLVYSFRSEARSKVKAFSFSHAVQNGACLQGDVLCRVHDGVREEIVSRDEIVIPGDHNVKNYLAAFAATDGYVPAEVCRKVAGSFQGIAHRLETVRIFKGVRYINDSIASSPTRTIAGLNSLKQKPIVILGGYDKHIPFDQLGEEVCVKAKAAVITGATQSLIYNAILNAKNHKTSAIQVEQIDDFDDAVRKAAELAEEGDIVLFSPACASFDHFKNFEQRGNHFKEMVLGFEE